MASFRKLASGKFQVIIRLKGLKPIIRSFSTNTKARDFARTVEGDTELSRKLGAPVAEVIDLKTAITLYLEQYQGKDPSVEGRLGRFKKDLGEIPVYQVDPLDIKRILDDVAARRAGATASRYKSNLSSVFRRLMKHPDYEALRLKNPVLNEAVPAYGQSRQMDRFLTEVEQTTLLQACMAHSYDRMRLAVLMLLTTDVRLGEVLGLRWRNIDFKDRVARLEKTKNGKPRLLPLTKGVIEQWMRFRGDVDCCVFPDRLSQTTSRQIKHDCKAVCEVVRTLSQQRLLWISYRTYAEKSH